MKFGRRPPILTAANLRAKLALTSHLDALGPAPEVSFDYAAAVERIVSDDWGMMGNDKYGDCVEADTGHALMLRTANTGTMIQPTEKDVEDLYSALTGFDPNNPASDQGTDENAMCAFNKATGFLGHKSEGYAPVALGKADRVKWTVQLFGVCRLGIYVTDSMIRNFERNTAWHSLDPAEPIIGGHDVPVVGYDKDVYYVVTWGKRFPVVWDFNLIEEAHAEVFPDWIKQSGLSPSGFNLAQLLFDLDSIAA